VSSRLAVALGRAVRAERARAGLSQEELGTLLGWSRRTVANIEAADRGVTIDELPALCAALGVPLARLLADAHPDDLRRLGL